MEQTQGEERPDFALPFFNGHSSQPTLDFRSINSTKGLGVSRSYQLENCSQITIQIDIYVAALVHKENRWNQLKLLIPVIRLFKDLRGFTFQETCLQTVRPGSSDINPIQLRSLLLTPHTIPIKCTGYLSSKKLKCEALFTTRYLICVDFIHIIPAITSNIIGSSFTMTV